jgi:hypothetical protein
MQLIKESVAFTYLQIRLTLFWWPESNQTLQLTYSAVKEQNNGMRSAAQ